MTYTVLNIVIWVIRFMDKWLFFGEVKNKVDEYYLFDSNNKEKWIKSINDIQINMSGIVDIKNTMKDLLISLGDAHTGLFLKKKINYIFDIDCRWVDDDLVVMPNINGYKSNIIGGKIVRINDESLCELLDRYNCKYEGYPKSIIKSCIIEDLKSGFDLNEDICIEVDTVTGNVNELLTRISLQDITANMLSKSSRLLNGISTVMFDKRDNGVLVIKILTFRVHGILDIMLKNKELISQSKVIVFDVRDNNGGFVNETKQLVSAIVSRDVNLDYRILSRSSLCDKYESIVSHQNEMFRDKQFFIICNENTMSSAEFVFIGGLRAGVPGIKIVGRKTAGFSGQAKTFVLNTGDVLQLTTKRYVGVTGMELSDGYSPDIVVNYSIDDVVNNKDKDMEIIQTICSNER